MTTFNDFVLSSPPKTRVVMDVDSDIARAIIDMADYIEVACRRDFIAKMYSLLLCSIIIEDTQESVDGFERIMHMCHPNTGKVQDRLYGAFLAALNIFFERYSRRDELIEELRDLVLGCNESAEELFEVRASRHGRYLVIC